VHSTTYRCLAENVAGRVLSRAVHVRAGKINLILISRFYNKNKIKYFYIHNYFF
jgi:hypothetical protein